MLAVLRNETTFAEAVQVAAASLDLNNAEKHEFFSTKLFVEEYQP